MRRLTSKKYILTIQYTKRENHNWTPNVVNNNGGEEQKICLWNKAFL